LSDDAVGKRASDVYYQVTTGMKGKPPPVTPGGTVADQLKVMDSASAGSIGAVSERANPAQITKARPIFMRSAPMSRFSTRRIEKRRRNKGMTK
jgi:hypothetical protein